MVLFTLAKQLTWTGCAVIFCVPRTLGALMHSILDDCRIHNANDLSIKNTSYENIKKNVSKNIKHHLWWQWFICYSKSKLFFFIKLDWSYKVVVFCTCTSTLLEKICGNISKSIQQWPCDWMTYELINLVYIIVFLKK